MNHLQMLASLQRIERALGIPPPPPTAPKQRTLLKGLADSLDLENKIRAAVPLKGTMTELATLLNLGIAPNSLGPMIGIMAIRTKPAGLEFSKHRKDHGPVTWSIKACPPDPST